MHLFLADAFGVSGQDLGLDLVDGASDGGQEQLPAHPDVLCLPWRQRGHCQVIAMELQRLLSTVISLQFLNAQ